MAEILLEHGLEKGNSARVVDLGCGTGMSGQALVERAKCQGPITGVDISHKSLDWLKANKLDVYDSTFKG